jgi:hypothetical protein
MFVIASLDEMCITALLNEYT